MEKATIRIDALRQGLEQSRGNELFVSAPCGGTVLRLHVRAPGAVVHDGDTLADLACGGERLQAELTVPPSGVGRLRPGQGVKLLYEAFPYQRHGVRRGHIRWVSPAGVAAKDGLAFRALADIEDEAIVVGGQSQRLVPGMGGRAEVVVGRRSLLSYAFEPIRQLRESLADAPAK
jgi:multidrug efflux pump subunit AcrA (membrane-fusion protein)